MNAEPNRPPMDADPCLIIAHCLKWTVEEVEVLVDKMCELLPLLCLSKSHPRP